MLVFAATSSRRNGSEKSRGDVARRRRITRASKQRAESKSSRVTIILALHLAHPCTRDTEAVVFSRFFFYVIS